MVFTKYFRNLIFVSILIASPAAFAEVYVLGGAGLTTHEYVDVSESTAFKLGIGYSSGRGGLGIQANYINFGEAVFAGGTISMEGTTVYGTYEIPLNIYSMVLKAGMFNITANDTGAVFSSTGLAWGITFNYEVDEAMYLFMDTEGYALVETAATLPEIPTTITFGLRYNL